MKLKPRNENPEGMQRTPGALVTRTKPLVEMSAIERARHVHNELDLTTCTLENFKWFIEERESIRLKKEAGLPRPWTSDEVLDRTRFTNIYRQHDKVSKFIFDRVKGLEGPELVYNLLIARLINRIDALDKVLPNGNLEVLLEGDAVFMNATAYQISPGLRKLTEFQTNREAIVYYPQTVYHKVYAAITSTTDIEEAVTKGNKAFGGHIRFAMLQVVLDYHYLTGHYDDDSNIPVGQGATAVVEHLGGLDYLSSTLQMKKYDVEHACCEYRKYLQRQGKALSRYSYKPNSMGLKEK